MHGTIIVILARELRGLTWCPLLKWALVSAIAVPLCFGLSTLIRKIPFTDRVV